MPQGTVKKVVVDRGFGFISGGRADVFFHFSALQGIGIEELHEGQTVDYEVEDAPPRGGKGPRAIMVRPANA